MFCALFNFQTHSSPLPVTSISFPFSSTTQRMLLLITFLIRTFSALPKKNRPTPSMVSLVKGKKQTELVKPARPVTFQQ